jgi:hypothetical protein
MLTKAMSWSFAALSVGAAGLSVAHAGTLINTNLPAGTNIVNINATVDGAAGYSSGQAFWYQPINGVALTLPAGTYQFRIIDPTDAAAAYPLLTAPQLSEIYTGWTYNSPWIENYLVFNSTATTDNLESQIFDGGTDPTGTSYASAQLAYDGTVSNGYFDKIRPAPPGRSGTLPTDFVSTWTFNTTANLIFVLPDNGLSDNTGGVSVVVTSAVPEPASLTLLAAGAAALGLIRKRRHN